MHYTATEKYVPSSDGIHTLHGTVYKPEGEIRGLFHLVHGMNEYIGRYDHLLSAVASQGYLAFGYDNLGHGKTATDKSELGFIAEKDGWKFLVRDVTLYEDAVREEYPDLPLILMGHSMGSFIARVAAEQYGDRFSGLIICGTGGPEPALPAGLAITELLTATKGPRHISPIIEKMAFGTYCKRFEHRTDYDWLTKDHSVIDRYMQDEYGMFDFTVSAMHDLLKLYSGCNRAEWFREIRDDLPILLISGEDDPVGNYGKGVRKVYENLRNAGKQDVTLRLYPDCRHEIHNDTCRDEMFAEILHFLSVHTKKHPE